MRFLLVIIVLLSLEQASAEKPSDIDFYELDHGGASRMLGGADNKQPEKALGDKAKIFGFFADKNYDKSYALINKHLEKVVLKEATLEANMSALEELLQKERSAASPNAALIGALEQVLSLKSVMQEESKCSSKSYLSLARNDRAVGGAAHKPPSEVGKLGRRVDWIVHQYEYQHAMECQEAYISAYDEKRETMDSEMLNKVEFFTRNIVQKIRNKILFIYTQSRQEAPMKIIPTSKLITNMRNEYATKAIYQSMKSMSKEVKNTESLFRKLDPATKKLVLDEAILAQVFEEHIVKPCEYYVQELGPEIYLPANFDAGLIEKGDRIVLEDMADFYLGYLRFRQCEMLLYEDKDILLKEIIELARSKVKLLNDGPEERLYLNII